MATLEEVNSKLEIVINNQNQIINVLKIAFPSSEFDHINNTSVVESVETVEPVEPVVPVDASRFVSQNSFDAGINGRSSSPRSSSPHQDENNASAAPWPHVAVVLAAAPAKPAAPVAQALSTALVASANSSSVSNSSKLSASILEQYKKQYLAECIEISQIKDPAVVRTRLEQQLAPGSLKISYLVAVYDHAAAATTSKRGQSLIIMLIISD